MTKAEKVAAIQEAKADAILAREDFARLGMGRHVLDATGFIADCDAQLLKLAEGR